MRRAADPHLWKWLFISGPLICASRCQTAQCTQRALNGSVRRRGRQTVGLLYTPAEQTPASQVWMSFSVREPLLQHTLWDAWSFSTKLHILAEYKIMQLLKTFALLLNIQTHVILCYIGLFILMHWEWVVLPPLAVWSRYSSARKRADRSGRRALILPL